MFGHICSDSPRFYEAGTGMSEKLLDSSSLVEPAGHSIHGELYVYTIDMFNEAQSSCL